MTTDEAILLARDFIPDQFMLDLYADMDDEYWFNYCRPDGETIVGASLVVVDKATRKVRTKSFTEDFPRVLQRWNGAETEKVPEESR
jgi:hypothetical protein